MRLGLKLLNSDATLNRMNEIAMLKIARGESVDLIFQLVDLDQKGLRYIPASGASVQVKMLRNPDVQPDPNYNTRIYNDYSIDRAAGQAFPEDKSIFKLPLTQADTATMISTNITVEVTEGSNKKIATLTQAIKIITDQES